MKSGLTTRNSLLVTLRGVTSQNNGNVIAVSHVSVKEPAVSSLLTDVRLLTVTVFLLLVFFTSFAARS